MRFLAPVQAVSAVALALLVGCSNGAPIPPKPSAWQVPVRQIFSRGISDVSVGILTLGLHLKAGYRGASFNTCPATGLLVYASDDNDETVNIFSGDLAGQAPCGILSGSTAPEALMVKSGTLYVPYGPPFPSVHAFHRGDTTPFRSYFDRTCGDEVAIDVTVSDDGYVLASNAFGHDCRRGSISVWKKSTGVLVGNYPNPDDLPAYFLTIQKDGTVYYDDGASGLLTGKCVKGTCGSFSNTGAVFQSPGGIRSVDSEHIVLEDPLGSGGGRALTYAPPSFGSPSGSCSFGGQAPNSIDLNFTEHHIFVTDPRRGIVSEFKYPAGGGNGHPCVLIGSVSTSGGNPVGIAVDRPESL